LKTKSRTTTRGPEAPPAPCAQAFFVPAGFQIVSQADKDFKEVIKKVERRADPRPCTSASALARRMQHLHP
jgi:hypothetical protein